MTAHNPQLTILISHPAADTYTRYIAERFPQVRAINAGDPQVLERHIGEADAMLAFKFPVEVFDQAKKLRWFQCTGAGVDTVMPMRDRATNLTVTNARGMHGGV